jgi:phage terminase Nu1 subunit (DNA packaging protein)
VPTKASAWVTPRELSVRLGISVVRCRQLADEQVLTARVTPSGNREYQWPECREQYIDYKVRTEIANALGHSAPAANDLDAARARLANAQAARQELALAKEQRHTIPTKQAMDQQEQLAARVSRGIKQLRGQFMRQSIGLTPEQAPALFDAIEDALFREMHSAFAQAYADPDSDEPEQTGAAA